MVRHQLNQSCTLQPDFQRLIRKTSDVFTHSYPDPTSSKKMTCAYGIPEFVAPRRPSSDILPSDCVPCVYTYSLQALGIFPCNSSWTAKTYKKRSDRQSYNPYILIWSAAFFIGFTLTVVAYTEDYLGFYATQLKQLEFFTAVTGVFRLSVFLHAPLTAVYMVYKSRYIPPLLSFFSQTMSEIFAVSGSRQVIRLRTVGYTAFLWTIICSGTGVVAHFLAVQATTITVPNFGWFSVDSCLFGLLKLTTYASALWFCGSHFVAVFYEVAPQMLAMILVFNLAFGFRQVGLSLEVVGDLPLSERLVRFEHTRCNYVRLQLLLNRTNEIFSVVLLTGCLRDIITIIAFTATILRTRDRGQTEDTLTFVTRIAEDDAFLMYIYLFTMIALVNTAIRTGGSIYCYEKALWMDEVIQEITAEQMDTQFLHSCRLLKEDIGDCSRSLVSAAVFSITKEYVSAIFGLISTYFLVIYQTRDSKLEMQEFLRDKDFKVDYEVLLVQMSQITGMLANLSSSLSNQTNI